MIPFDFEKFTDKLAASRDPREPTPEPQQHRVTLEPPTTPQEHWDRWDEACAWARCREHVRHDDGHLWSRHRNRDGSLVFTFSDDLTALHFALRFKGV